MSLTRVVFARCRLMSTATFVICASDTVLNDRFMAKVVTNDQFSGLRIGAYGNAQQQQQRDGPEVLELQQTRAEDNNRSNYGIGGGGDLDAYIEYADSLAKCGRVCESLDLYARCFRRLGPLPANVLWHVTSAFLELIRSPVAAADSTAPQRPLSRPLGCGVCDLVLRDPVTLVCGHTFCRRCAQTGSAGNNKWLTCRDCGQRTSHQPRVNVLVKSLAEKLWPAQLRAAELMDEGAALYRQDKLHSALLKFNQAHYTGGDNYELLNIRSRTLLKLGLHDDALLDADRVTQMKPKWSKGRFTRGMTLLSMGKYQDALLELSLSAVLGENMQKLESQINDILHRLLVVYSKRAEASGLVTWDPISHGLYLRSYLNAFIVGGPDSFENDDEDACNAQLLLQKPVEHETTFLKKSLCDINSITGLVRQIFIEVMHTKYNEPVVQNDGSGLEADKSLLDESDFNCVLCCGMFRDPVTTPCGHTYCMDCLEHNFDYSFHCPLCLTALSPVLALSKKNVLKFVDELMCLKYSEYRLMRTIDSKPEAEQPDNTYLPVFVCTNAFPSVSCPLHVFEPRYRLMIRRCIKSGTRRFAMISHCRPPMKFAEYGTVLEIKDQIIMGNGCSMLSTIGTQRFKVLVRKEHDGYDVAKVQYIQDENVPSKKLSELKKLHDSVRQRGLAWFNGFRSELKSEILRTVGFPPSTETNWEQLADGPAWTWWLLSLLPLGQNVHVDLLANTSIEVRLRVINKILSRIERSSLSRRITSSPT